MRDMRIRIQEVYIFGWNVSLDLLLLKLYTYELTIHPLCVAPAQHAGFETCGGNSLRLGKVVN